MDKNAAMFSATSHKTGYQCKKIINIAAQLCTNMRKTGRSLRAAAARRFEQKKAAAGKFGSRNHRSAVAETGWVMIYW